MGTDPVAWPKYKMSCGEVEERVSHQIQFKKNPKGRGKEGGREGWKSQGD